MNRIPEPTRRPTVRPSKVACWTARRRGGRPRRRLRHAHSRQPPQRPRAGRPRRRGATLAACSAQSAASPTTSTATTTASTTPSSSPSPSATSSATYATAEINRKRTAPTLPTEPAGVNVLSESGIVRGDIRSSLDGGATAEGVPLTFTFTLSDLANGNAPYAARRSTSGTAMRRACTRCIRTPSSTKPTSAASRSPTRAARSPSPPSCPAATAAGGRTSTSSGLPGCRLGDERGEPDRDVTGGLPPGDARRGVCAEQLSGIVGEPRRYRQPGQRQRVLSDGYELEWAPSPATPVRGTSDRSRSLSTRPPRPRSRRPVAAAARDLSPTEGKKSCCKSDGLARPHHPCRRRPPLRSRKTARPRPQHRAVGAHSEE